MSSVSQDPYIDMRKELIVWEMSSTLARDLSHIMQAWSSWNPDARILFALADKLDELMGTSVEVLK